MSNTTITSEELLQMRYIAGSLVISLSKRALKQAAENIPGREITVVDDDKFFESVLDALHDEMEDGTTLVHRMLDEAVVFAHDQGMDGFAEEEEEEVQLACPQCKLSNVVTTDMAYPKGADKNRAHCPDCQWKGTVMEMIPAPRCLRKSSRKGCDCPTPTASPSSAQTGTGRK